MEWPSSSPRLSRSPCENDGIYIYICMCASAEPPRFHSSDDERQARL